MIKAAVPAPARFAGGHPAKRTFQAIRIAVNDELDQLDAALPLAWELLAAGRIARRDLLPLARGPPRQAVLRRRAPAAASARPTCRSAAAAAQPEAELAHRRAIAPSAGEIAANPRAASAHLRVARKLGAAA